MSAASLLRSFRHHRRVERANDRRIEKALRAEHPKKSRVRWSRGRSAQLGTVLDLSGQRLKVRNDGTGTEYWITVYDVLNASFSVEEIFK